MLARACDVTRGTSNWLATWLLVATSLSEYEAELDYFSSSFDEGQDESSEKGVEPYCYEPYTSEESALEEEREEIAQDIGNRLHNIDWCLCAQCQAMSTAEEFQSCHEIARTYDKITVFNEAPQCIINHPVFPTVCLDQFVLETAYYQYRQQYDRQQQFSGGGGMWQIGSSFDGVWVS